MVSFLVAIVLLVLGYLIYSKVVERIIEVDPKRPTPAVAHPDGVDYVPMKAKEMAMIMNRSIFSIFKFDEWLHEKYGDYESENKSMHDMFIQLFGDDCDKIAYYFGIEVKEK